MSVDVLEYLNKKGCNPKRASRDNYHFECPFCNEPVGKRGRLYVNVDPNADIPGLYHCKLCDAHGSLVSLRRQLGDAPLPKEDDASNLRRRHVLEMACAYYQQALDDATNLDVYKYLTKERGLTPETIEKFKLGYAKGDGLFRYLRKAGGFSHEEIESAGLTTFRDNRQVDFLQDHITIPYLTYGSVQMIRGRAFGDVEDGRKYVTGPGQKSRLFNSDSVFDAAEVVICEGEFDCMVLDQQGFTAVAVPGANTWQDTWTGYFEDVRRVWIVFDRDERETGTKGGLKVLDALGPKARQVELPPHDQGKTKNDITEYFVTTNHSPADFTDLLRNSRGHLVTVREAITEHDFMMSLPGLRFGLPRFDHMINPGLKPTQLMIALANTGVGKTVWLLNTFQSMMNVQPDMKILFCSLEQTRSEWWERARRIYRFWNLGATDDDARKFWEGHIWIDDRNRITPSEMEQLLADFEYETGGRPDLVAIDYLGYWAQSFSGERYERTSDAVMTLKRLAKEHGLPIIAPHQVSRSTTRGTKPGIQASRDSGVVEETADFVVVLWREDTRDERTQDDFDHQFHMGIAKSRHGGTGHTELFYLAPLSLSLVPAADRLRSVHARNEASYLNVMKEDWETAQIRHLLNPAGNAPVNVSKERVMRAYEDWLRNAAKANQTQMAGVA